MTNTEICNMALSYLSKGRITSFTDNTEEAKQCTIHYEHCRKMILRSYTWGFARRVVQLSKLSTEIPGYTQVYAYPAKCLAVRFIFDDAGASTKESRKENYDIAMATDNTKAILTDVENAWCEYTYDTTDPELFPEEFIEALARLLASSLAMVLSGNANIQQTQYQLYQVAIAQAKTQTAQEREKKPTWPTDYARARFQ